MKIEKKELKVVFMGTSGRESLSALNAIRESGANVVGILENYKKVQKLSKYDKYARNKSVLKAACKGEKYIGTDNVNAIEIEEWLKDLQCNLICVCSAFQLMKSNIINIPVYGVLNAHGSLLPDYRGPNPPYWCFRNMEKMGGVTLHFINEGEDTGDIIVQHSYDISFGASMEDYVKGQEDCIRKCYLDGIEMLTSGTVAPLGQGTAATPKARNVKREDYLLDYEKWEVEHAYHFLNGTNGISYIYGDKLHRYMIVGYKKTNSRGVGKYDIQCKDGYISVRRKWISPESVAKNIMKGLLSHI